jgi:hypothetical protein
VLEMVSLLRFVIIAFSLRTIILTRCHHRKMFIVSQFYRDQMSLCAGMAVAVMVMAGFKTIKLDRASQSPLSYSQAKDKIFGHLSKPLKCPWYSMSFIVDRQLRVDVNVKRKLALTRSASIGICGSVDTGRRRARFSISRVKRTCP